MKVTKEVVEELHAACKAAWGQCMTMAPYLTQPHKRHMEDLQEMCKSAMNSAEDKEGGDA